MSWLARAPRVGLASAATHTLRPPAGLIILCFVGMCQARVVAALGYRSSLWREASRAARSEPHTTRMVRRRASMGANQARGGGGPSFDVARSRVEDGTGIGRDGVVSGVNEREVSSRAWLLADAGHVGRTPASRRSSLVLSAALLGFLCAGLAAVAAWAAGWAAICRGCCSVRWRRSARRSRPLADADHVGQAPASRRSAARLGQLRTPPQRATVATPPTPLPPAGRRWSCVTLAPPGWIPCGMPVGIARPMP